MGENAAEERAIGDIDIVDGLASALDADDYDAAARLLDAACVYDGGTERIIGPEAILATFRGTSEWGSATFDRVVFTHSCEPCSDCTSRIRFVDDLERGGRSHRHVCLMHVTVEDGRVIRLRLENIDDQKASLAHYLAEVGVQRP